jgi:UDP-2,3-diacylglucosamine hydrolase
MPDCVLMISDLHLSPEHPKTLELLEYFIQNIASGASALYILGDFFEAWIGDDDDCSFAKKVSARLLRLSQSGVKIYFMQGNRDFLLKEKYCAQSGMTLLEDPYHTTILGHHCILSHGDLLCTDDTGYQRFRRVVRNSWVQKLFLMLPLDWRKRLAQKMRGYSRQTQKKQGQWCNVNQLAVGQLMRSSPNYQHFIHGHTHEGRVHSEESWMRYVLGDWHEDQGSYIEVTKEKVVLKLLSKTTLTED